MKNKKFNQGFSFVELLAAIVIMGLLSGLAIVSIRFLTNKAEKEYYKAQESEIVMAAKSYTQDNRNYLPKRVGFKKQIYLKTLQDKKYIGDVVDRGKKKCDPTKSYVQVYRYDKNHYNYVVNLVCNSYKSMDNDDSNITEKPTVKINFLNVSKNDKYSDAKVNLIIEDDNKISSYSYIIIKDGEEVKNSGDIDGKLQTKIDTNISLTDYVPGKITVKVVATNTFGNQGNASKSVTVKNENAPTCEVVRDNSVKDVNGKPTCEGKWIKDPNQATVEAQVKCIDKSGSGCQKDVYTQVFFGERKTDFISMADNTGNTAPCEVYVCIDVTKPTTPVIKNDYENVWTNKPYSIELTSYDETAGIAYFEYRYPDSTGVDGNGVSERKWHKWENSSKKPGDKTPFVTTKFSKERAEYVEVRACDRAGNCSDIAKSMIKIDKTAPTCTITKNKANPDGLNHWYVTNVNLTLNRNDVNGSGDRAVNSPISYELKNTNSASYNGTTTGTQKDTKGITWYGFIKDEAGNKTSCNSGSFKVDTTKPDKPSITNMNDNKWVNKSYTISVVSKDATSGIDYFAYRYPSSNSPGENTWNKYANSSRNPGDNTAFTTTNFSKERDENVEIKVCDVAGNCSDTSSSRIRIDKTAPTCTITRNIAQPNGNNGWYKSNVVLTLNRKDPVGSSDRAVASPVSYGLKNSNSTSYNGIATVTQTDINSVTWYGFIKDEAGNATKCNSGSFKVDATKPTMSFSISGETAVVKCSDAMSGLATPAQKKQNLTGNRNITVSFSCTDNAGNITESSHTYRYNSCKYTKNTCSYGCDSCYNPCLTTKNTCKSKTTCDNCGRGSPSQCVPGYISSTCTESKLCHGMSRSTCNNTTGCRWHGGSTAHGDCGGRYTYEYTCSKYDSCATRKNTCERVCTTDYCATGSPNTCVGGYEDCNCSSCYYGSPNACNGGGFELN